MDVHLYCYDTEALIASMLTPEEFGVYYSVGSMKKARGQAIFSEIDPDFRHDYFRIEDDIRRCVPHEDGSLETLDLYLCLSCVGAHVPKRYPKTLSCDSRWAGTGPRLG